MQVTVNGESRDVAGDATVASVLETLGLNPKTVVVQCNDEVVERNEFDAVKLNEGDQIEIVRFVGGG